MQQILHMGNIENSMPFLATVFLESQDYWVPVVAQKILLQWNPGITKCQGTGRITSLYRGFVINGTPV